jgi:hypothetical protein
MRPAGLGNNNVGQASAPPISLFTEQADKKQRNNE